MGKAVEGLEVAKAKSGRPKGVNKGEELRPVEGEKGWSL